MRVFTPEWVQSIRTRYESRPVHPRPYIHFLATSPELQNTRAEIEAWVSDLAETAQARVIPRLQSNENSVHTYNELLFGSFLRALGYRADYERALGDRDLTPDWYVHARGKTPAFIVEVFTANPPDETVAQHHVIQDLLGRLQEIPLDAALTVRLYQRRHPLDHALNRKIEHAVRQWLVTDNARVGQELRSQDVGFELLQRDMGYSSLQAITAFGGYWIDDDSLRRKIEEKIRRYRRLAADLPIALVVAVVPHFMTAHHIASLEAAVYGTTRQRPSLEKFTGRIVREEATQITEGLFVQRPLLSAVVWARRTSDEWRRVAIRNPHALNPLPADALGEELPKPI